MCDAKFANNGSLYPAATDENKITEDLNRNLESDRL